MQINFKKMVAYCNNWIYIGYTEAQRLEQKILRIRTIARLRGEMNGTESS